MNVQRNPKLQRPWLYKEIPSLSRLLIELQKRHPMTNISGDCRTQPARLSSIALHLPFLPISLFFRCHIYTVYLTRSSFSLAYVDAAARTVDFQSNGGRRSNLILSSATPFSPISTSSSPVGRHRIFDLFPRFVPFVVLSFLDSPSFS